MADSMCLKKYINCIDDKNLSKTRKKMNKKSPTNRVYGLGVDGGSPDAAVAAMGESMLFELLAGGQGAYTDTVLSHVPNIKDEEEEQGAKTSKGPSKIDSARQLFQTLINRPDSSRKSIIDTFEQKINVTHSTAVSYYERLAKEAGLTNLDDAEGGGGGGGGPGETEMTAGGSAATNLPADTELEMNDDIDVEDEERIGVIRTVKDAHLIYKQQDEDGSFSELWIYNISKGNREMGIRRDILAGTDIPPKKSQSPDGSQTFAVTTMGNAQYLHVTGLQN